MSSNTCLRHRKDFQNAVNTLSKAVKHFLSKCSKFCIVRIIQFCSNFTSMYFTVTLQLNLFSVTVTNADTGSLKSLHTFLEKKRKKQNKTKQKTKQNKTKQNKTKKNTGKSILQVPDTGTRVLDNTRPFLCSSIVSF